MAVAGRIALAASLAIGCARPPAPAISTATRSVASVAPEPAIERASKLHADALKLLEAEAWNPAAEKAEAATRAREGLLGRDHGDVGASLAAWGRALVGADRKSVV